MRGRGWLWWGLLFALVGVMLPRTGGFFWDDWTPLLVSHLPQPTLATYIAAFQHNRPGSGLLFGLLFPILGTASYRWSLVSMGLHVATAAALMAWLRALWPRRPGLYAMAALLFLVHPAFTEHAIQIAFTPHWTAYALYLLSWWASVRGWRSSRLGWWALSAASLSLSAALVEYFLPLELVRAIWFWALTRAEPQRTRRLRWLVPLWVGLFLGLVMYVHGYSRSFQPDGPSPWVRDPLHSAGKAAYSLLYPILAAWAQAWPRPETWLHLRQLQRALQLAGQSAILAGYAWWHYTKATAQRSSPDAPPGLPLRWLPAIALLGIGVGLAPFLAVGRFAGFGLYTGRYTLPALWAAASLWAWFIMRVVRPRARLVVLTALAASAGFIQGQALVSFETSWARQQTIYAQLHWRLPSVPPGTAWLVDGALAPYVAEYVVGEALNVLYADQIPSNTTLAYWAFDVRQHPPEQQTWQARHKIWTFQGERALPVAYKAVARGGCVWVLDARHANENPYLSPQQRAWARQATIPLPETASPRPDFVKADPVQWCAYYQRAELARQRGDWARVLALWREVQRLDLRPALPFEYGPFIEAFARQAEWDQAAWLTRRAWHAALEGDEDETRFAMCRLWQRMLAEQAHPAPATQAYEEIDRLLGCTQESP